MHSFDESDPVDLNEADLEVLLGAEGRVVKGGAVLRATVTQAGVDEQAVALTEIRSLNVRKATSFPILL